MKEIKKDTYENIFCSLTGRIHIVATLLKEYKDQI